MKLTFGILITFCLANNCIYGQKMLTKEEIIKYWDLRSNKKHDEPVSIVNSDSTLNVKLLKLVDSLQTIKIDSVIVFSTANPGNLSESKCDTGLFPITTFVIWNKKGETYLKKIRGTCQSEVIKNRFLHLFNFYSNNDKELQLESFMPIILGGQMNKDKKISYSMSWVNHELKYSFYYKVGNNNRSFQFGESWIDKKESIVRGHNLALRAYHWWLIVKKEIDKID